MGLTKPSARLSACLISYESLSRRGVRMSMFDLHMRLKRAFGRRRCSDDRMVIPNFRSVTAVVSCSRGDGAWGRCQPGCGAPPEGS
jgi:hypothetical protein